MTCSIRCSMEKEKAGMQSYCLVNATTELTPTPTLSSNCLASKRGRSRVLVACRDGVVDIDLNARVSGLVCSREGDKVRRRRATTACDINLSARKVELSATDAPRIVERDVFVPHQVLSGGDTRGNLDVVVCGTYLLVSIRMTNSDLILVTYLTKSAENRTWAAQHRCETRQRQSGPMC
jgi:hypothetical protein